ncbi:MAG: MMPL family transporter [Gammaproteobacteria bacterium]|nr:MMPL family transporter [Gammaproteobacteria bacterium]
MSHARSQFFDRILSHPWRVLSISTLLLIVCFMGLGGLSTSNDYRSFLDDDYPGMVELAEIEELFYENKSGVLLVIPNDGTIFTEQALTAIQSLTADSWLVDKVARVDSIANFQHTRASGDELFVESLLPEYLPIDAARIELTRQVSLNEPATRGLLVSTDQSVGAINITFEFGGNEDLQLHEREAATVAFMSLLDQYRQRYPEIEFRETGTFFVDYHSERFLNETNSILTPVMIVVMMLLLALLLQSLSGLLCAMVIVVGSGVITMGVFGWSNMLLEAVAAMGPIVIMTLAVADSVHIIVGAQTALGQGFDKTAAIKESLRINFMPVFLTSLTTALGVITFSFTDFPSLRKLGVIIALGVTVAFILSVTLLPVLMQWLPLKARLPNSFTHKFFRSLAQWSISNARIILPVALVSAALISSMASRGVIDESFQNMFHPDTEVSESIRISDEKLAGMLRLDVAVFSAEGEKITDPKYLRLVEDFSQWVLRQPDVTHTQTLTDTYKRLNKSMHGDQPEWYRLPEQADLAAQYLLLYEMSLPYGLDLSHQLTMDKTATRIIVSGRNVESVNVVALTNSIRQWFELNAPEVKVISAGIVALMSEVALHELIPKMARGGVIAILMVSLVLFFALRSWLLGLFGMLANIIPLAVSYGIWAMSGNIFNFVSVSVAGICLGMVVDFAVHFLDKFRHSLRSSGDVNTAIYYAYEKVANPLLITAVVLMAGFFVLSFTKVANFAAIGQLTPLVISLALAFDLVVLPALLALVYGRASNRVEYVAELAEEPTKRAI